MTCQPREQVLLARLAVFANGFERPSAEAVCGTHPLTPEDVLDLLTSLVEKSLVLAEERSGGMRYRLLETIRDYAMEKLTQRNELATTAALHCDHYFLMAKAGNQGLKGHDQAQWPGWIFISR